MPSARILSPADYRRMPWKNGGGRTTEIASFPEGAGIASFAWRASVADVERDGPFSAFPGVDRTLVLLAGNGVRLACGGGTIEVRALHEPIRFAGDAAVDCVLVDGPVRDFNLMLRRDVARGTLVVVRDVHAASAPARFVLCYAAVGACECLAPDRAPMRLREGETLVLDGESKASALHVNPVDPRAVALVASIDAA